VNRFSANEGQEKQNDTRTTLVAMNMVRTVALERVNCQVHLPLLGEFGPLTA
jgi:hypothetical protein